MSETDDNHDSHIENTATCLASDADCICEVAASKAVAKSEAIKFNKHIAAVSVEKVVVTAVFHPLETARIDFIKPFYLSDSFYNLAPKRGPPIL